MRVLVATDAWHPQVNGVVRTLTSLRDHATSAGIEMRFLLPEGFRTFVVPSYPSLRLAWPNHREIRRRIEAARPDAIHIATEGPVGLTARALKVPRQACRAFALRSSWETSVRQFVGHVRSALICAERGSRPAFATL